MPKELVEQLAVELIPGIGPKAAKHLISYCGSPKAVFDTPKNKLLKIPGIGPSAAESIITNRPFDQAQKILNSCIDKEIRVIHFLDDDFPNQLKQTPDHPNILYVKGEGHLNPSKSIAIVGTRRATNYGKKIVQEIVNELAAFDVTIISGLAYGIDIEAHKAALKHHLPTFGILAGGLDRIYPSAHKKYANEMMENGGITSESVLGTIPDAHLFPARNRIIAGFADATIVVEAADKGGALITAYQADSYNRPVFAVAGNIDNEYSKGTNRLIASQKALIYTGVEDLIYHLNWDLNQKNKEESVPIQDLSAEEKNIYDLIEKEESIAIDSIAIQTNISINKVAAILLSLEFKNLIKSLPGKKYSIN